MGLICWEKKFCYGICNKVRMRSEECWVNREAWNLNEFLCSVDLLKRGSCNMVLTVRLKVQAVNKVEIVSKTRWFNEKFTFAMFK